MSGEGGRERGRERNGGREGERERNGEREGERGYVHLAAGIQQLMCSYLTPTPRPGSEGCHVTSLRGVCVCVCACACVCVCVIRLTVHDCFTDHLGWRTGSGPAPLHQATPTSFTAAVGEATPTKWSDCVVVIDSVSTLIDFHSLSHVCHLLHQLGWHRELGVKISTGWGVTVV